MTAKASDHPGPSAFFLSEHRECDRLWSETESQIEAGEEVAARDAFAAFDKAMRRHFAMEEEVLFPAVEAASGMGAEMGPTAVMRMEHEQMRGVLDQMGESARADLSEMLDHGDSLLMLIQQHNMKEEGMLYPMCDQMLRAQWAEIAGRLDRY